MTSTVRQYAQVARYIIAADIIQYYIHAASLGFFKDNRDEIFAVNDQWRALRQAVAAP